MTSFRAALRVEEEEAGIMKRNGNCPVRTLQRARRARLHRENARDDSQGPVQSQPAKTGRKTKHKASSISWLDFSYAMATVVAEAIMPTGISVPTRVES